MSRPLGTFIAPEEHAYPNGGQTRPCRALYPDGKVRRAWAGIPDTYFTIPAHGRMNGKYVSGYLTVADWGDEDKGIAPAGTVLFRLTKKEVNA
jgi:hypothetical protein